MSLNNQGSRSIQDLFNLKDKVAIVTGGAGTGYGEQITQALAESGAQVIICSRDFEKAKKKASIYREKGLLVEGAGLELTNEASICRLVEETFKRYNQIDILFNNAAENHIESFETIDLSDWNRVISANITGTMLMSREVAPHMLRNNRGVIINISSIYGIVSPMHRIYGDSRLNSPLVYGVTKAAIIQMTRFMATHWAPKIRVNCITAGGLYSEQDPSFVNRYCEQTPLGRMAGSDDLKGAALYLASDASGWVTGQNLIVDGGWTIW